MKFSKLLAYILIIFINKQINIFAFLLITKNKVI